MTHTFTQNYRIEQVEPYLPVSCEVSHTCPRGTEGEFGPNKDVFNVPTHFEGGPFTTLEFSQENTEEPGGTPWSPAGQEITNVTRWKAKPRSKADPATR